MWNTEFATIKSNDNTIPEVATSTLKVFIAEFSNVKSYSPKYDESWVIVAQDKERAKVLAEKKLTQSNVVGIWEINEVNTEMESTILVHVDG